MTVDTKPIIINCPQCHGFGYTLTTAGKHVACSLCHSKQSVISFVDNDLIWWGQRISSSTVLERKIEQAVRMLISTILLVIGVLGAITLAYALYTAQNTGESLWSVLIQPSQNMAIVWITIVCDMFLYYRLAHAKEVAPHITVENKLSGFVPEGDITDWAYWKTVDNKRTIEVSQFYTETAFNAINESYRLAKRLGHKEVRPVHLLLSVFERIEVRAMLLRLETDVAELIAALKRIADKDEQKTQLETSTDFGADIYIALLYAYIEARNSKLDAVNPIQLFTGTVLADQLIADTFFDRGITIDKIRNLVGWSNLVTQVIATEGHRRALARSKPKGIMNRAMTARPTRALDAVSQDFTQMAKGSAFLPPVGRDEEIQAAFRVLQSGAGSVLLVGESGVGKTTILEGIANLMSAENVPGALEDKRLVVTDPGSIIAAAPDAGNVERQVQSMINDIVLSGNILWGIEDIHTLLGAGSTGSSIDIGRIVMNYVSQGYIRVIGTTTTPEFQKYIEPYEPFRRRFQIVQVPELKPEDALVVLEGRSPYIESKYRVFFTYDALEACVDLSTRFIKDLHLPAKAISVMEEAAVLTRDTKGEKSLVTKDMVQQVMSQKTNVAVSSIAGDEAQKLLHLEDTLHQRVIGQHDAIAAIARALRRARQDIRDVKRPIASLLFLGPTGVGKTETAKAIAEAYFGNEQTMMRFDMSEYDTPDSISKMIGDSGREGAITEAVRRTPFGIILLDELEKAHPDVLDLFLQVMEDGRLTDGMGRTADFTNTMIIATSNAATDEIHQAFKSGKTSAVIEEQILESQMLKNNFRTEFLNRFDDIVVFTPLSPEELGQVCELLLQDFAKQMASKNITLQWGAPTVQDFVERGYDPMFGARPLRRLIQDTAQDAVAKLLLENKLGPRDVVELLPGGQVSVIKAERI